MMNVGDPVGLGLVDSLARPGGNVTGTSLLAPPLATKRLELLKEIVPGASRLAVLWRAAHTDNSLDWRAMMDAAPAVGIQLQSFSVGASNELEGAIVAAVEGRADGLLTLSNNITLSSRTEVVELALQHRLPSIYDRRAFVATGGLMWYGSSVEWERRRGTYYVDRILKGTKPADLPVEQPMTFDFVINLSTAEALGLTVPPHVLLQATEVIR